jgi:transcriptional regulator with XRE-family HTH domain
MRDVREARGLSVEEMAGLIGVHPQTIRRWEHDRSFPNKAELLAYAGSNDDYYDWLVDAWRRDPRNPKGRGRTRMWAA